MPTKVCSFLIRANPTAEQYHQLRDALECQDWILALEIIGKDPPAASITDPLGENAMDAALRFGAPTRVLEHIASALPASRVQVEQEAERIFSEVEQRGGVVPAIEAGYFQREIHRSAVIYQRAVEDKTKRIVGVNCYTEGEDGPTIDIHKIDPATEQACRRNLAELRQSRDSAAAAAALDGVRAACKDGSNLMERFVAAAHAYCTLGEIAGILREEYGEFQEPNIL